jgi:hypothetical protein
MVNSEAVFYTNSDSTVLKLVCFLSFPHPLVAFSASFVWFVLGRRGDPFNKVADCNPVRHVFWKIFQPFYTPNLYKVNIFWTTTYSFKMLFLDNSLMKHLQYFNIPIRYCYFEISN